MLRDQFENILSALTITKLKAPIYTKRFWEVCQLIADWNSYMKCKFFPSWISCLDESMSKWVGKYSWPGFICVPGKLLPLTCDTSDVLYKIGLVEGRDAPKKAPPK